MSWAERLIGPQSKYDDSLPYSYEARVSVLEWDDAYNSYYSDTICGLINFLRQKNIQPNQVTLHEIYQGNEAKVETCLCLDDHDLWLSRPNLCKSLHGCNKRHIGSKHCSFQDQSRVAYGP